VFEPHQLLERLVPLIPAPRAHQVRCHGVLAPCAGWRDLVIPAGPRSSIHSRPARSNDTPVAETGPGAAEGGRGTEPSAPAEGGHERRRHSWADLLRRVFAVDVFECPDCGGRMRILAAIHPPEATRDILECLGLPSRTPPTVAARPEPEPDEPVPPGW
jgi:hypothetical protein